VTRNTLSTAQRQAMMRNAVNRQLAARGLANNTTRASVINQSNTFNRSTAFNTFGGRYPYWNGGRYPYGYGNYGRYGYGRNGFFPFFFPGYGLGALSWLGGGWGWGGYGGYGYGGYGGGYGYPYGGTTVQYVQPVQTVYEQTPIPVDTTPAPAVNMAVATVKLVLPEANATVWFDGQTIAGTGLQRQFNTPLLESGYHYTYTVKGSWMQDGERITVERQVQVSPGETTLVDFTRPPGAANVPPPAQSAAPNPGLIPDQAIVPDTAPEPRP